MAVRPEFNDKSRTWNIQSDVNKVNQVKLAPSQRQSDVIKLGVYYETLCPDSIDFINTQLYPTYKLLPDLMQINLVPFGKARVNTNKDPPTFSCQHGPRECKGNIIQTCALNDLNITTSLAFINCMEQDSMPEQAGERCAKELWIPYDPIEKCATGPTGAALEVKMADLTNSLNPPLYFVPWITVNEVFNQEYQQRALTDLYGLICDLTRSTDSKYSCMRHANSKRRQ